MNASVGIIENLGVMLFLLFTFVAAFVLGYLAIKEQKKKNKESESRRVSTIGNHPMETNKYIGKYFNSGVIEEADAEF